LTQTIKENTLVTGKNKYLQVWHVKKLESGPWRIEAEGRIILQFISVFVKIILE
jgi:hypothetical protein